MYKLIVLLVLAACTQKRGSPPLASGPTANTDGTTSGGAISALHIKNLTVTPKAATSQDQQIWTLTVTLDAMPPTGSTLEIKSLFYNDYYPVQRCGNPAFEIKPESVIRVTKNQYTINCDGRLQWGGYKRSYRITIVDSTGIWDKADIPDICTPATVGGDCIDAGNDPRGKGLSPLSKDDAFIK